MDYKNETYLLNSIYSILPDNKKPIPVPNIPNAKR